MGIICIRTEEGVVVYVKGREWEVYNICIGAGDGRVVYVEGQERDEIYLRRGGRRGVVFLQGREWEV